MENLRIQLIDFANFHIEKNMEDFKYFGDNSFQNFENVYATIHYDLSESVEEYMATHKVKWEIFFEDSVLLEELVRELNLLVDKEKPKAEVEDILTYIGCYFTKNFYEHKDVFVRNFMLKNKLF
jgi:hypothetical protein